ncbi:MAG TPA: WD40 repeat domain-containing serine/threonine protein kinase [Thermoanaerobaculia bacterium]|nr:WD40 repeat domain-containing serine/threonine protein kinase [Thermoanaerobaculia bacterium]
MTLGPGSRLGPYEILAQIGAGGMGEVWRARDTRLGRDVAIKVLPASFSADADRLRRFEQEARAAGILNHPNITAVFDIGESEDGSPYVVQELLEGETLRHELAGGRLPPRKAIDHAVQIAHGLAAAHEKGIVHRDLKPENVFVTKDGRLKILDFGLARMTQPELSSPATDLPTATPGTEPGMVLGTLGYMSPEQVRGRPADARSDIFSFGAILYEMLAGQRAFKGDSAADTMSAILREDPPELSLTNENVSPGLERIVRHCLEKTPEQRFQSARDIAFDLEALSSDSSPRRPAGPSVGVARSWRAPAAALAALLLMVPAAFWIGRRSNPVSIPAFRQLTFRRGAIRGARFTPDGQTLVFAAAWEGKALAIYLMRTDSADAAPVDFPGQTDLLAVGRSGEAALQLGSRQTEPYVTSGTLASAPIGGGQAPRERLQGVQWADWSPDGTRLAIVRDSAGRNRLESPVGTVLYETAGWIGNPRFSPQGDAIALIDHWGRLGDLGSVVLVDLAGHARKLSEGWSSLQGLAWPPAGKEIWFTGTKFGGNRALYAVGRSGDLRLVHRQTGSLTLADISSKGEALLVDAELRLGIMSRAPGDAAERDFSFLDFTALRSLSSDGKLLLFDEASEGGGDEGSIFLRKTDGSPPVRLGPGFSMAFSPDAKWVLAGIGREPNLLRQLPVGAGEPRTIAQEKFAVAWGDWLPDGRVLVFGGETGRGARLWVQNASGGDAKPITAEGVHLVPYTNLASPDGKFIAATGRDGVVSLFPLSGGEPKAIRGLAEGEVPCSWDASGKFLFVYRPGEFPARVFRVEVETGARSPWKDLMPPDPTGVTFIRPPHFSGDGGAYAYSFTRVLHTLFLARDLR